MPSIPDTSTIINHPSVLDEEKILIPHCVLSELDKLKTKKKAGYEARRAIQKILSREIPTESFEVEAPSTDDKLLGISKEGYKVWTDDVSLYLRGKSKDLNIELYSPPDENIFTGMKNVHVGEETRNKLFDKHVASTNLDLYPNQFVNSKQVMARYKDGKLKFVPWKVDVINNVKLNRRQLMAIDILMDEDVTVAGMHGPAGTGKTSLAIATAIQQIKQGKYNRLILSAPKIQRGRQQEIIGYLPGDLDDKLEPWLKPFYDNIEEQHHFTFETLPLSMIQGRNLKNTIWIITEFQNVKGTEADQIVERVGSGSKLIYEGDLNQKTVKSSYDGLTVLTNALKDEELAGAIELKEIERSRTARLGKEIRTYIG